MLKDQLQITRDRAIFLGNQTKKILEYGFYMTASGKRVEIKARVDDSVLRTVTYNPEDPLPISPPSPGPMAIEVCNESTLAAAHRLVSLGFSPAALNFAAADLPGGGFLRGALAQEEYLARSSALYACLKGAPMYSDPRSYRNPFNFDYVIYSPHVLVLRDDDGELLESPYPCSILTSPAVHAIGVREHMPGRQEEIAAVMQQRMLKVLAVAVKHGHKALVLGAWGCGAFGNDPTLIAGLFRQALESNFHGAFERVIFAIADWSEELKFIGPFLKAFGERLEI